jgi:hypothetical protein
MRCKHKEIKQKSVVKNLPKLFEARHPRNCLCSLEQQEALVYCLKPKGHKTLLYFYFRFVGKGHSSQDFNSFLG